MGALRREKIELTVQLGGEPGEEQVRELLRRVAHVRITRDGLGNWHGALIDYQGWEIERLFYQNHLPLHTDHNDQGPIGLCRAWDHVVPVHNEADLRLSPEWGSLAVGVLREIADAAIQVLERELEDRWRRENNCPYSVVVAAHPTGRCRTLFDVARDDPTVLPVLRDAIREDLP